MRWGNIRPPFPWGHTHLFRKIIHSVDRSPLVGSGYNKISVNVLKRERLPFTLYAVNIELALCYKAVHLIGHTYSSYYDIRVRSIVYYICSHACDRFYIRLQITRHADNARIIIGINIDIRCF